MDVPDQLIPVFPAYEERFLCLVLSLLRSQSSRVIYVTSQPILPRLIDYYFGLVPELDTPEARSRFAVVSLVDGRNVPLTKKLLARPGAIERIRALVAQPELAFLLPFATSRDEVELAVRLGIPLYGADPALEWLGTKSGSRRVFAEEGVPHAYGFDVGGEADVLRRAARAPQRARPSSSSTAASAASATRSSTCAGRSTTAGSAGLSSSRTPKRTSATTWRALADQGGIVEERIEGEDFRSPSAQLRISPSGQVDILSTHDQVLGGPHGQTYFGCRFPADPEYAPQIAVEALKVGRRLAREGAIGRCAVDFVAVRERRRSGSRTRSRSTSAAAGRRIPSWRSRRSRTGSTTRSPGEFRTRLGDIKHYVATDHLDAPAYQALTPDDLLDVVAERSLGWDAERETGVALHMVSALAVAGRIGLTAIGDTPSEASALYQELKQTLDSVAAKACGTLAHQTRRLQDATSQLLRLTVRNARAVELDDDDRRAAAVGRRSPRSCACRRASRSSRRRSRRASHGRSSPALSPTGCAEASTRKRDDRLPAREAEQAQRPRAPVRAGVQAVERAAEVACRRHPRVRPRGTPRSRRAVRPRVRARRHPEPSQAVSDRGIAEAGGDPVRGEVRRPEADLARRRTTSGCAPGRGEARSAGGEHAELDCRGGREARVLLEARVPPGAELVDPDADRAVRPSGNGSEAACECRVRAPQPVAGSDPRKRCERPRAAEAVGAIERLGARDLVPAAREQVGAERPLGRADAARRPAPPRRGCGPRRSGPGRRPACSHSRTAPRADSAAGRRAERRRSRWQKRARAARAGSPAAACARQLTG